MAVTVAVGPDADGRLNVDEHVVAPRVKANRPLSLLISLKFMMMIMMMMMMMNITVSSEVPICSLNFTF